MLLRWLRTQWYLLFLEQSCIKLRERLLKWLRSYRLFRFLEPYYHKWRAFIINGVTGGLLFVLGSAMLYVGHSKIGWRASPVHLWTNVLCFILGFLISGHITWRQSPASKWRKRIGFLTVKGTTFFFQQWFYTSLLEWKMQYLVANVASQVLFAGVNYVSLEMLVFQPRVFVRKPLQAMAEASVAPEALSEA